MKLSVPVVVLAATLAGADHVRRQKFVRALPPPAHSLYLTLTTSHSSPMNGCWWRWWWWRDPASQPSTQLFSIPAQPTPNEGSETARMSILPVSTYLSNSASASVSGSGSSSRSGSASASASASTPAPTLIGTITDLPPPSATSSRANTSASSGLPSVSSSGSRSASSSSGASSRPASSSGTQSKTSNPAAAPTAFGSNLVAGVVALAGLAVAI
ncbi:hypothetical protein AAL_04907 [Moelleriella libera RCEF 2490]|uniref:Uncharacterized protein n=1 Tax=Moelleriella libera RCEF 2490 TaxID=1081109 RepID=A0A168B4U9_9HYPO|nr:hypothetical protein AAL_04907 [Moelleriella libera RCEF 2490]